MADYIKWNCRDLSRANDELNKLLVRLTILTQDLRDLYSRSDPEIINFEGIGRELRSLIEGFEEDAKRLRNENTALERVISIYQYADDETLKLSESLPTSIVERNLMFEDWFTDLLR